MVYSPNDGVQGVEAKDMLRLEDYKSGVGCTNLQREYILDMPRMCSVSKQQLRRKMLVMAVALKSENVKRASEPSRYVSLERFDPDHLIVPANEVDIYMMFDRPVQSDKPRHSVETLLLGETGYLNESGAPCVGGNRDYNHADYDYGSKPFYACQGGEIRLHTDGELRALNSGTLRVRRIASALDVCVGNLADKTPMINYRIHISYFDGNSPIATIPGLDKIPENGELIVIGPVVKGCVILQLRRKVEVLKAGFLANGDPHTVKRARKLVPAHREREFGLYLKMNRSMLDCSPERAGENRPFLVDPTKWAFSALFRFKDLDEIVHSDHFAITPQLQYDLLEAVGPRGLLDRAGHRWYLRLRAATTSRVAAINVENATDFNHVEIVYENGVTQIVPDYPNLSDSLIYTYQEDKSRKPLDVGDWVNLNQAIGDFVPRLPYLGWDDLHKAMGPNLLVAVTEFLNGRAIKPGQFGWEGPNILLDYRYCYPFAEQLGIRSDYNNELQWYWDLRDGASYLDKKAGYIIYPPMRYPDWHCTTMQMAAVSYYLGLQAERIRANRAARKKGRKQRSDNKVDTVVENV